MPRYADIEGLPSVADGRRVAPVGLRIMRDDFGPLPRDWLDFLVEVGAGTVGPVPGAFKIYPGLVEADDIYDDVTAALSDLLLFGDDFQGYCVGFERSEDWRVVEVSPIGAAIEPLASSFEEYVRLFVVPDV